MARTLRVREARHQARSAVARRDAASPWGFTVGHNGGGPCYSASVFHAFGLGGLSVCAMGAIERGFSVERDVAGVFDYWSGLETDRS